jgi:seryl-tRNA synthetase
LSGAAREKFEVTRITIPVPQLEPANLSQLRYALAFASEDILSCVLNEAGSAIDADIRSPDVEEVVRAKLDELIRRYSNTAFGMRTAVDYEFSRELPVVDAWQQLLERRWVTPVGEGHVILRGPAARLMQVIDRKVEQMFVSEFAAEPEMYPATIRCETLDRCNHFASFPEHLDFVAHLARDVDVLKQFSEACKSNSWSPELHQGVMNPPRFAISPSCCYHCYEGMEGWELPAPGRCTTMVVGCHRYEGANHTSMSRLRAFTMREIVWVGQPRYVIEARAKAEAMIIDWAKDWELVCTLETANDMFFTDDYAVKASFQRQQQAKRELRMLIPQEGQSISVFSSNFHASTFGKAFNIKVGERVASSACLGWGYERWVYAIFSQFGLDSRQWPENLRRDFETL